tara:strand:- start:13324 stop:14043 length:720 start_codon:yes stop_codon:yes gene_type:complete
MSNQLTPMGQLEYEAQRSSALASFIALKQRRRVFLGDNISILFENRETVLGVLHESLRANGSWQDHRLVEEIYEHQHLVPTSGMLSATFMLQGGNTTQGIRLCEELSEESSTVLTLHLGDRTIAAKTIGALGTMASPVQYLSFAVGNQASASLARPSVSARLSIRAFGGTTEYAIPWPTRVALSAQLAEYGEISRVSPIRKAPPAAPSVREAGFPIRLLTALRISRRVAHARPTIAQFG